MSVDSWGKPRAAEGAASDTPVSRKPVRLKLETSQEMRRALARLIRSTLAGVIETADLSRYANALMILHRMASDDALAEITARLDALEGRAMQ